MPNHINMNIPIASTSASQHEQTHCDTRPLVENIRSVRANSEDINEKANLYPNPSEIAKKSIPLEEYLHDWDQWLKGSSPQEKEFRESAVLKLKECISHNKCNQNRLDLSNMNLTSLPKLPPVHVFLCDKNKLEQLPELPEGLDSLFCRNNYLKALPKLPAGLTTLCCFSNKIEALPALPKNLESLNCAANKINKLPALPDNLKFLECSSNKLDELPALPKSLESLNCAANQLEALSALPKNLESLNCAENQLKALPKLLDNLKFLNCTANKINKLPALPDNLNHLSCFSNNIKKLPALPENLESLNCAANQLEALPALPDNLKFLECSSNKLDELPALPKNLEFLNCAANKINKLPALPKNLSHLNCFSNNIKKLSVLPENLESLNCAANQLEALPALPDNLKFLECSSNKLDELPALPKNLEFLNCAANKINKLPALPDNLSRLNCFSNNIKKLPELPGNLSCLNCFSNNLESLPNLPDSIQKLYCNNNNLGDLPKLPDNLEHLNCAANQLEALPALPDNLKSLECSSNKLYELPELPKNLVALNCSSNNLTALPQLPGSLTFVDYSSNNISESFLDKFIADVVRWFPNEQKNEITTQFLAFQKEENVQEFAQFMSKLSENCNYASKDTAFKDHIAQWLLRLSASDNLRELTFVVARDATESCEDRVTLSLNRMMQYELCHNIRCGKYDKDLSSLMMHCREMFRLQHLEKIAADKIDEFKRTNKYQCMDENGHPYVDEIEVYLAYQTQLRERLELNTTARNMRFNDVSGIKEDDLQQAELMVKTAENDQFVEWLSQWEPWQELVKRVEPTQWEAASDNKYARYEKEYKDQVAEQLATIGITNDDVIREVGLNVMNDINKAVFEPLTLNFCESKGLSELLLAQWMLEK